MTTDPRFLSPLFPRSSRYHPDWILGSVSGGAHSLWLTEWLVQAMDLRPGMRVLDLGCGLASSSIFLAREFDVQVWATDLWFSASERQRRISDAGCASKVYPIHAEAHALPFAAQFFDALVSIDSFMYYGTDDLYLNYIASFIKPGGAMGIALTGLMREIDGPVPDHLAAWWEPSMWCLHSAPWWQRHWEKTGIVDVERADSMADGWQRWLDWQRVVCPENTLELQTVDADRGRYLGYVRCVGRRLDVKLDEQILSIPSQYTPAPLLRDTPR